MEAVQVEVEPRRTVRFFAVGPDDAAHVVVYFHSPSTAGEELGDAAGVAAELGLRLFVLQRPSCEGGAEDDFVSLVAEDLARCLPRLDLRTITILAWSGGTPYALASAARLGPAVRSVHLVSPVPGELTGPGAVPDQSERLQQVAQTTDASAWASGPAALRDYLAVAAPWPVDFGTVTQPVTVWSPADDDIVPPRLVDHLASRLPNAEVMPVEGGHDWLTRNWHTVLRGIADGPAHNVR